MRAGTTTLYQALRSHPSVYMAPVKETNYFVMENGVPELPLDAAGTATLIANSITSTAEYMALFRAGADAVAIGEVSPSYLFSPGAPARILDFLPHVRLIVILRDPVDRAYSAYLRRAGVAPDPETFIQVAEREHEEFLSGRFTAHYPLLYGSMYSTHLEPYLRLFPGRLKIEVFETFWQDTRKSFAALHRYLGVPPITDAVPHLNRSGVPRFQSIDRVLRRGASVKRVIKQRLPPLAVRLLVDMKQSIENWSLEGAEMLPPPVRSQLIERYFDREIETTERLVGLDLSHWRGN